MKGTTRPGCTAMSGNGLAAGTYYPDPDAAPSDGLGYTTTATNSIRQGPALSFPGGLRIPGGFRVNAGGTGSWDFVIAYEVDGTL